MLCKSCSNVHFQWFEDIAEAPIYAQNPENRVFERCNKYVATSVEQKFFIHQPNFELLGHSKDRGCCICAALWFAFSQASCQPEQEAIDPATAGDQSPSTQNSQVERHELPGYGNEYPIVWRIFASRQAKYASGVWVNQKETIYAYCGRFYRMMFRVGSPEGAYAKISDRITELWESQELLETDNSTRSHATFELAGLWYENCLSNHPECAALSNQSGVTPMLPKRVIDVKEEGSNPVLYEPPGDEVGDYICLSHCWGNTTPMHISRQTSSEEGTESNSSTMFRLPPLETWPKSFQDAVNIARRFKIRFLWIDNTSIIQGEEEDWSAESQKMAQYFGNATITIAASWAPDDNAGIYHMRNPLLTYPLCLIASSNDPPSKGYYVSLKGLDYLDEYEVVKAPLFSRAWVLQEQQLSRRLLKFGARGIYWQCFCCDTTTANIMPRTMRPYQHADFGGNQQLKMHIRPSLSGAPANAGRNPYLDLWYATVQEFTSRNMKIKSDVLPAISGLAQAFAGYMNAGDRYVAGLWQSDLILGLLWTAEIEGTRRHAATGSVNYDPKGFYGPSWSWISQCHKSIQLSYAESILAGGKCSYVENSSFVDTQIIGVDIDSKFFYEPFGEIRAGKLYIKAKLPSVRIDTAPYDLGGEDNLRRNMLNSSLAKTNVRLLSMDKTPFPERALWRIEGERGRALVGECDIDDIDSELWKSNIRSVGVDTTFLPLIMYRGDPHGLRVAGLMLLPSGNEGEFVRVGRGEIDLPSRWCLQYSTLPRREIVVI